MTALAADPTPADIISICIALEIARETCRAQFTADVYEHQTSQCRDMIRAQMEKEPSTIFDAAYEVSVRVEEQGNPTMCVFVYAAAADLYGEGLG